jgi:hypothetical protein
MDWTWKKMTGRDELHLAMELAGRISHEYTCLVHGDLSVAYSLLAMSRSPRWDLGKCD